MACTDSTERPLVPESSKIIGQEALKTKPGRRASRFPVAIPGATARAVGAVTLIVALGMFLMLHRGAHATTTETSQPVIIHVAAARKGNLGVYIDALGTVVPEATVNLYSQVTGQVLAVHYREGQMVRQGDALIDLDPRLYQAQLQQAEGTLDRDRGILAQQETNLGRYREAFEQHAVAKQVLDDQEQAVVQVNGSVRNDVGQVQYAQTQLSYCHLTAPISGRVGLRLVDVGNTVFSGSATPLVVITQLQPITVVFNVAEDHLSEVQSQLRQHRSLVVDAFDRSAATRLARGTLLTIDNQIDTTAGTLRFRGEFSNQDSALFPNQFVNARLLVETLKEKVLIPNASIQRNGTQAFAYVVHQNKVSLQNITELSTDGVVTAVEGLEAGEFVALSSFDKLQDGTKVTIEQSTNEGRDNPGTKL
jgi:multidrug efflux system membrane fusion protein